jgi:hypothetical protein
MSDTVNCAQTMSEDPLWHEGNLFNCGHLNYKQTILFKHHIPIFSFFVTTDYKKFTCFAFLFRSVPSILLLILCPHSSLKISQISGIPNTFVNTECLSTGKPVACLLLLVESGLSFSSSLGSAFQKVA